MVGANPNPDLQIQYSIQNFVKLYLDLDCILFTDTHVFGFGFGFPGRGFVPISGTHCRLNVGNHGNYYTINQY